jgi:hypothetical protein
LLLLACGAPDMGGTGGGGATGGGSVIGGGIGTTGGGGGAMTGGGGGTTCTNTDTWAGFGNGFFVTWCSACHGTFSHASVAANTATYAAVIGSGTMPRGATLDAATRAEIVAYLNCGAP